MLARAGSTRLVVSSRPMTPFDQPLNGSTLLLRARREIVIRVAATPTPMNDAHRARARDISERPRVRVDSAAGASSGTENASPGVRAEARPTSRRARAL